MSTVAWWVGAVDDWDAPGHTQDVTTAMMASPLPPSPRPCGCWAESDRACQAHEIASDAGRVCVCLCHDFAPEDL